MNKNAPRAQLVSRCSINGAKAYAVSAGDGSYHIQRSVERSATAAPLTHYERVINILCERILELEEEVSE